MTTRREAIGAMGAAAYGVGASWRERYAALLARGGQAPAFFSDAERALMTVLADMIIPRDDTSGSATDAGALPYIEFVLSESGDSVKREWHDGLRWLDEESRRRFQKSFVASEESERARILDDIAWPARTTEPLRAEADFFTRVRDLVAAAFFSSAMGVQDLGYRGGVFNPEWRGAPPEALAQLGVSYDDWDRHYQ